MKTASLMLNRTEVLSKLIEFLKDTQYKNTQINLSYGIITTELRVSFFKTDKIQLAIKPASDSATQIEIRVIYNTGNKTMTDSQWEEEIMKRINFYF